MTDKLSFLDGLAYRPPPRQSHVRPVSSQKAEHSKSSRKKGHLPTPKAEPSSNIRNPAQFRDHQFEDIDANNDRSEFDSFATPQHTYTPSPMRTRHRSPSLTQRPSISSQPAHSPRVQGFVEGLFALGDRHVSNRQLTVTEMTTFLKGTQYERFAAWLTDPSNRRKEMKRFDLNHDGALSEDELCVAAAGYFEQISRRKPARPRSPSLPRQSLGSEVSPGRRSQVYTNSPQWTFGPGGSRETSPTAKRPPSPGVKKPVFVQAEHQLSLFHHRVSVALLPLTNTMHRLHDNLGTEQNDATQLAQLVQHIELAVLEQTNDEKLWPGAIRILNAAAKTAADTVGRSSQEAFHWAQQFRELSERSSQRERADKLRGFALADRLSVGALRRMRQKQLARCYWNWYCGATMDRQHQREREQRERGALKVANTRAIAQSFKRWHGSSVDWKRLHRIWRKVAIRLPGLRLSRAFAKLKEATRGPRRISAASRSVRARWVLRWQSRAWNSWSALAAKTKREARLVEWGASRMIHAALGRAFRGWGRVCKDQALDCRRTRGVCARWMHRQLTRGIRGWRVEAAQCKHICRQLSWTIHRLTARSTAAAYSAWSEACARQRQSSKLLCGVCTRLLKRTLSRACSSWRREARCGTLQRRLLTRAVLRIMKKSLGWSFGLWQDLRRRWKRGCGIVAGATMRWVNRSLFRMWNHWSHQGSSWRRQSNLVRRCVTRFAHRDVAAALSLWVHRVFVWNLVKRSCNRWNRGQLCAGWMSWRGATLDCRRIARVLRHGVIRLLMHNLASAFANWHATMWSHRSQIQLFAGVLARWRRRQLSCAWVAWECNVTERVRLIGLVRAGVLRLSPGLAQAFATWSSVSRGMTKCRACGQAVRARWLSQWQLKALDLWRNTVEEAHEQLTLLRRVVLRLMQRQGCGALQHWRDWAQVHCKVARTVAVVKSRWTLRQVALGLHTWRYTASEKARAATLALKVVARFSHESAVTVLGKWRRCCTASLLVGRACGVWLKSWVGKALRRWRHLAGQARAQSAVVLRWMVHRTSRDTSRAYFTWKVAAGIHWQVVCLASGILRRWQERKLFASWDLSLIHI
eukprot:TRINITY_DN2229_c0_g1_i6.p1 TRINITY_DN2229_c0_g1~~TRINITY_DN2229_c0_g1_i6.p1  ORF type:complete len:1091 (-),score=96.37 TRINITY_DN2229_c0_g1_i6:125-3397(-)